MLRDEIRSLELLHCDWMKARTSTALLTASMASRVELKPSPVPAGVADVASKHRDITTVHTKSKTINSRTFHGLGDLFKNAVMHNT